VAPAESFFGNFRSGALPDNIDEMYLRLLNLCASVVFFLNHKS